MLGPVKVISLGFRTDLMLRAMAGAEVVDRGSHLVVRTPGNPGFWWGNFLLVEGPLRPGDVARWEAEFAAEFPHAEHFALGVDGEVDEVAGAGLVTEVNTVLTATRLVGPPRDAVVRRLVGDGDWEQAFQLRLATEESEPSAEHRTFLERRQAEYRALCEGGHGAWFGAFVEGQMRAGAGLFTDGGGLARYQNVETHPAFRRRGLASAVVHHAGTWGLRQARTLVIVADPGYHAIRLYRALGFNETEDQVQLLRPPPQ